MLKLLKWVLVALLTATAIFVFGTYYYSKNHVSFNKESEIGNSNGNIYNGGLFCQQDTTIYFTNDYDDGALYSMNSLCENMNKISVDKAVYINSDDRYIYYVKADSLLENSSKANMRYNNGGVYRMNNNGTFLKNITSNPASNLILFGNYLYYQQYYVPDGMSLARTKLDATDNRILTHSSAIPYTVQDGTFYYYPLNKPQIKGILLDSFTTHVKYKASYQYPIAFGDYIYYINPSDKNYIYRMKKDGTDPTKLISESCATYNITNTGKYLYYQVGNGKSNRISRLNLETMKKETVAKGSYRNIFVTDYYVFFNNYEHTKIFKVIADGGEEITELITRKK